MRSDRGTSVVVRENGRWVAAALRVYPAEAVDAFPDLGKASDEDRRGVLDARARLIRAIETDDVEGLLASLTADHVTMAPDEPAVDARALRAWHERRIAAFATKVTATLDDLRVEGEGAVDSWHGTLSLTPRAGGAPVSMAAKGIWFWRREPDGRWRLARSTWNRDSPAPAVDLGAEKAAIEKLLAAQLAATNQAGEAGADGYVSVVTDDVLWLPPNGQRATGRKAVRDLLLPLTSARRWSATWKADNVEIAVSGDIAYAVGTYELSHENASGTLIRDTGKFLDTFRKQADGRWRETTIMFSSDLPAGGTAGQ